MRIQGYSGTDEEKMDNSIKKKYDRDLLIRIGNQNVSVFSVPESFLELAKEAGTTSPTRHAASPLGPPKGLISPLSRGNSRGNMGGSLYGGSIRNNNGSAFGLGLMGPLMVPPPAPANRETKSRHVKIESEFKLPSNPNAWKPNKVKNRSSSTQDDDVKSEDELVIEGIIKETRGILNKLTPENFDRLMEKFIKGIPLENKEDRIAAVITVLFEKAVDEPAFSASYAKMVQAVCSSSPETSRIFRKQILDRCQHEFQRSDSEEDKVNCLVGKINDAEKYEEKELLKIELEELRHGMRKRALGNVRFIGELYKLQMLTPRIMVSCVKLLLLNPDDEKLECLCKLLTTVGSRLDEQLKTINEKLMDHFFVELEKLSIDKKISSRIRFALMDLVDLRHSNWIPRRLAAGPKKLNEVHQDAYLQELEEKRQIQSLPPPSPGGSGGRGHNSPISHVPKKADWTTVQNKAARFQKKPIDKSGQQSSESFTPQTGPMFGSR